MSPQSCGQCSALRTQVTHLTQQLTAARRQVDILHQRVAILLGGLRSTVEFLNREFTEPSMPRRQLLPAVHTRLTTILDRAEGRRR